MSAAGCCRPGYSRELCGLFEALLSRPVLFDKNGFVNSDGRRLLEALLRLLVEEHPEHRKLAARTRREPSVWRIVRLAELSFYACDASRLIETALGLWEPYHWRVSRYNLSLQG